MFLPKLISPSTVGRLNCFSPCFSQLMIRMMSSLQDSFNEAQETVKKLKDDPGNEPKLRLYALFKQSTVGPCNLPKPGMFDMVGKYKWEAWNSLGQKSKEEAMNEYVKTVDDLAKSIGLSEPVVASSQIQTGDFPDIQKTIANKVLTLKLNRPTKRNAITVPMYKYITDQLNEAAKNDQVRVAVITGEGDYFSSGNDLSNFNLSPGTDLEKLADDSMLLMENFINAFIDFPKPLIAALNGPVVGIMATTLALYDVVYCTEDCTFHTPFSALAQSPEGCSSYTFPKIFGPSKSSELLMFNYKMTAQEAERFGFVSKIVPKIQMQEFIDDLVNGPNGIIEVCSPVSLKYAKKLIRNDQEREVLRKVNHEEALLLKSSWLQPDFPAAIAKFFSRKK